MSDVGSKAKNADSPLQATSARTGGPCRNLTRGARILYPACEHLGQESLVTRSGLNICNYDVYDLAVLG